MKQETKDAIKYWVIAGLVAVVSVNVLLYYVKLPPLWSSFVAVVGTFTIMTAMLHWFGIMPFLGVWRFETRGFLRRGYIRELNSQLKDYMRYVITFSGFNGSIVVDGAVMKDNSPHWFWVMPFLGHKCFDTKGFRRREYIRVLNSQLKDYMRYVITFRGFSGSIVVDGAVMKDNSPTYLHNGVPKFEDVHPKADAQLSEVTEKLAEQEFHNMFTKNLNIGENDDN